MTASSLKRLFAAHFRELQAYLTERLRDPETAADLTQETFLRYAERGVDGTVVHERSYLYRTAHNLAVDHLRQIACRRTDALAPEDMAHVADERPDVEAAASARQELERLRGLIAALPERTRRVFVLNRVEGLTYVQVARRLGISESSVQKHLSTALHHVMRHSRRGGR